MDTPTPIELDTIIRRAPDPLSGEIDREVVLLSAEHGAYFQLNDVASRVWALLESPTTPAAVIDRLIEEFEVSRPVCEAQVLDFVRGLFREGLIRVA
jgi:hypothetical protein